MAKRGRPRHPDILTPREWDVLALLREGLTNEQIAQRLDITERTARYHVSEILSKLGVSTRQEAASWTPEERRPWWTAAFAPLLALRRPALGWVPVALAGGVVVALGVGVGLLVWGLVHTASDGAERYTTSSLLTLPAPDVEPAGGLEWVGGAGTVRIVSMDESSCGDKATAEAYGVPVALEVARWPPARTLLGLEAVPYDYVPAQVEPIAPWEEAPVGWELSQRPNIFRYAHVPAGFWMPEYFARRLDKPALLFRYADAVCDPARVAAYAPEERLKRAIFLPEELPHVVIHRQGDFLSPDEVTGRFEGSNVYPGGTPVWLELGNSIDFATTRGEKRFPQFRADPEQVLWEVLLDLGDLAGPQRPGWGLASYTIISASGDGQASGWGCCIELRYNQ